MRRKKAFTLIELLVVIAIIALLLAILMPSLRKAKKIAQTAICRSNLKHWGTIMKIYTHENNNLLPDGTGPLGMRRDWITTSREDYPVGQGTISQCPSAAKFVDYGAPIPGGGGIFSAYKNTLYRGTPQEIEEDNSYGMNLWSYSITYGIIMNPDAEKRIWRRLEVTGASSSTVPLLMDSTFAGSSPHYDAGMFDGMDMVDSPEPLPDNGFIHVYDGIRQFAIPRHGSGSKVGTNVLFFDMSVRHVMVKEIWSLKWHRQFETNLWRTKRTDVWKGDGKGGWWDRLSEDF